jgi:hypothetical protein
MPNIKPRTPEQKERAFKVCGINGTDEWPDVLDKLIAKVQALEWRIKDLEENQSCQTS